MKKLSFLLLLLVATFTTHAKNPVSYRFGIDAGMVGNGYSLMISPLELQLSPSFQVGIGGLGLKEHYYFESKPNDIKAAYELAFSNRTVNEVGLADDVNSKESIEGVLQIASLKYDIKGLTFGENFVPFIKISTLYNTEDNTTETSNNPIFMNVSNSEGEVPSKIFGDAKIGVSLYSKKRGCNLSAYVGATYGAYTRVSQYYSVNISYEYKGEIKESVDYLCDSGIVKLPVLFNFGVQFEFGGGGAFGYPKQKKPRKQRSGSGWNNALNILSTVGEGLTAAGEAYGAASTGSQYSAGSSSQYNGSTTSNSSTHSQSYYQNQYDRWANNAQRSYEQLTGHSTAPGSFTVKIGLLRDQQREMESIRKQAARDGIHISKSYLEDVNP